MTLMTRSAKGAPLTQEDHDTNLRSLVAGVWSILGTPSDGATDARSAVATADTTAVSKGVDLFIPAGTYSIQSNITIASRCIFAKGAKLKPASGVNINLAGGYEAGDWQQVFDISAGGTVTGDAALRWYVTPQHFGALANAINNDSPAISAACRFAQFQATRDDYNATVAVGFPANKGIFQYYRLDETVYIHRTVHMFGMMPNQGRQLAGVTMKVADGLLAGIVFVGPGSVNGGTEYEPQHPPHRDAWKVYSTNTSTGFVNLYTCKQEHVAATDKAPGSGPNWQTFWLEHQGIHPGQPNGVVKTPSLHAPAWISGTTYKISPGLGLVGSASNSIVERLNIEAINAGKVRHGWVHNCVTHFKHCRASYFEMSGFRAIGQTELGYAPLEHLLAEPGISNSVSDFARIYDGRCGVKGNVNGSTYFCCYATNQTNGHGFYASGNNAGLVNYYSCDAAGNNGAGYEDDTAVGCNFIFGHSAQNTWKVLHNGVYYMCTKGHLSTGDTQPGVGSNWTKHWIVIPSATTKDADWALGTYYVPCGGINVSHPGLGFANIFAHYSEGGIEMGVIARSKTSVWGGVAGGNYRTPYHGEFGTAQHYGQGGLLSMSASGFQGATDPFGAKKAFGGCWGVVASSGAFDTGIIQQFGDERDSGVAGINAIRLTFNTVTKAYHWLRSTGGKIYIALSGNDFSRSGYTGAGHVIFPDGVLIGDNAPNYPNLVKHKAATNISAIAGDVVRGQVFWYTQPSPGGKIGAVCTTGGKVGSTAVIKEFGAIDL